MDKTDRTPGPCYQAGCVSSQTSSRMSKTRVKIRTLIVGPSSPSLRRNRRLFVLERVHSEGPARIRARSPTKILQHHLNVSLFFGEIFP